MEPPSPPARFTIARPPGLPVVSGLQIRELRYPPGLRLPTHEHDGALLCYALRGGYWEGGPRRSFEAPRGSLSYQPAGEPHADRVAESGLVGLRVELAPAWLDEVVPSLSARGPAVVGGPAAWFARSLVRETRRAADASPAALESLVLLAVTELVRAGKREGGGTPDWLRRVRERLHDDWAASPSLGDLAREAGVHRGHLARAFQRQFGCTVGEYRRERRLERAHELVAGSDEPLADVALACGFADQSHLGRAFKARFGVTPGALRRYRRR